jgi:hypothetical protein
MKLICVLLILILWLRYLHTEGRKPVTGRCHTAINLLYLALMIGAAVMTP